MNTAPTTMEIPVESETVGQPIPSCVFRIPDIKLIDAANDNFTGPIPELDVDSDVQYLFIIIIIFCLLCYGNILHISLINMLDLSILQTTSFATTFRLPISPNWTGLIFQTTIWLAEFKVLLTTILC